MRGIAVDLIYGFAFTAACILHLLKFRVSFWCDVTAF